MKIFLKRKAAFVAQAPGVALLVLILFLPAAQAQDTTTGLAFYLPFDGDMVEQVTSIAPHESPGVQLGQGKFGQGMVAVGKASGLKYKIKVIANNWDTGTAAAWVKLDPASANTSVLITSNWHSQLVSKGQKIESDVGAATTHNPLLGFPDSAWTHVASTWQKRGDQVDMVFYINGQRALAETRNLRRYPDWSETYVGAWGASFASSFTGSMDEVLLYSRQLTDADVAALVQGPAIGAPPPAGPKGVRDGLTGRSTPTISGGGTLDVPKEARTPLPTSTPLRQTVRNQRTTDQNKEGRSIDFADPDKRPDTQVDPKGLPGDQFDPKRLPGDQFDPKKLPGDQFKNQRSTQPPAPSRGVLGGASDALSEHTDAKTIAPGWKIDSIKRLGGKKQGYVSARESVRLQITLQKTAPQIPTPVRIVVKDVNPEAVWKGSNPGTKFNVDTTDSSTVVQVIQVNYHRRFEEGSQSYSFLVSLNNPDGTPYVDDNVSDHQRRFDLLRTEIIERNAAAAKEEERKEANKGYERRLIRSKVAGLTADRVWRHVGPKGALLVGLSVGEKGVNSEYGTSLGGVYETVDGRGRAGSLSTLDGIFVANDRVMHRTPEIKNTKAQFASFGLRAYSVDAGIRVGPTNVVRGFEFWQRDLADNGLGQNLKRAVQWMDVYQDAVWRPWTYCPKERSGQRTVAVGFEVHIKESTFVSTLYGIRLICEPLSQVLDPREGPIMFFDSSKKEWVEV